MTAFDDITIEIDDWIRLIKRETLPGTDIIERRIGHAVDQDFRDFNLLEF